MMSFWNNLAIGFISVVVIVLGAREVVRRLAAVAKSYEISQTVLAMTVISVGTSLPELILHLVGSFRIVAGNVSAETAKVISATVLGSNIGSDVIQQTLVLGLVVVFAAISRSGFGFQFPKKFLLRYYAPMITTTLMTLILGWDGTLSRIDGLVLVGSFVAYITYLFFKRDEILTRQGEASASEHPKWDLTLGILFMFLMVYAAHVFLDVVKLIIENSHLSGSLIGVILVGLVSAFPEMITAISGLRRGAEGISLGTLIGSNITNPLLAIGLGAIISTYSVPIPLIYWDLPMETVTAAVLLTYLLTRNRLSTLVALPFERVGLEGLAGRLRKSKNRVLTIPGALLLVGMYGVYFYVRVVYFSIDFV
jgi:cation:H+ antiporter